MGTQAASSVGSRIRWIDVDADRELTLKCAVDSVPTLLLFRQGKLLYRWEGQTNPEDIPGFFQRRDQDLAFDQNESVP